MNFKTKKSLGQHFLKSKPALRKIISAGELSSGDTILEIGPGKGVLTQELLKYAKKVIAVEKDVNLFEFLQGKFTKEIKNGSLVLTNDDILDFSLASYKLGSPASRTGRYKLIANIPYNITGAILKKFLTEDPQPERMVLLVQKEVAERIVARDGKESILSISVKAYGKPAMAGKVPARYFSPPPRVDSAILLISDIARRIFNENHISEGKFWQIVRKGFAHKRKKLSNNLKNVVPSDALAKFYDKRAENLALSDWISLAK